MSQRDSILHQLEVSHGAMMACLDGISEEEANRVPVAGMSPVVWQVGHIAVTDATVGQWAGGKFTSPQGYPELFQTGSAGGAGKYPQLKDVTKALDGANQALMQIAREADYETPQETPLRRFYGTVGEMHVFVCFHRGWHIGKLTTLRTLLGKARLFG